MEKFRQPKKSALERDTDVDLVVKSPLGFLDEPELTDDTSYGTIDLSQIEYSLSKTSKTEK